MVEDNRPLFSVIIPFYNGFKKFARGYQSLKDQEFKNFEVIIVDDCSNKEEYGLLATLIEDDASFCLLRLDVNTGGPGQPRNIGVEKAAGHYLMFMDMDDWLEKNTFQKLSQVISNQSYPDVVQFGHRIISAKTQTSRNVHYNVLEQVDGTYLFTETCRAKLSPELWTKAWKKDLWIQGKVVLPTNNHHDDLYGTLRLLYSAGACVMIEDIFYNHNLNDESITENPNERSIDSLFEVIQLLMDWQKEMSLPDPQRSLILQRIFRSIFWEVNYKKANYSKELYLKLHSSMDSFMSRNDIGLKQFIETEKGLALLNLLTKEMNEHNIEFELKLSNEDVQLLLNIQALEKKLDGYNLLAQRDAKIERLKKRIVKLKKKSKSSFLSFFRK